MGLSILLDPIQSFDLVCKVARTEVGVAEGHLDRSMAGEFLECGQRTPWIASHYQNMFGRRSETGDLGSSLVSTGPSNAFLMPDSTLLVMGLGGRRCSNGCSSAVAGGGPVSIELLGLAW